MESFSQSFKISFFNSNREGAKLYQCFSPWGAEVNYSVQVTANVQGCRFRFGEGPKLV